MYILKKAGNIEYEDVSLREELKEFLQSNGIPVSALAEQLGIDRRFLERYISEGGDIKFAQAIKIMQVLDIEPAKFIQGFKNDLEGTSEEISDESTKLSFLYSRFDIPSLKEKNLRKLELQEGYIFVSNNDNPFVQTVILYRPSVKE